MHVGIFVKVPFADFLFKGGVVEEIIINEVFLTLARITRSGGDYARKLRNFSQHAFAKRGFTATRGAGYDNKQASLGNIVSHVP